MIVSVASGKGGTGKTMVSTNLAAALADNVQLLDCDVEEPNAHLFIKPEWTVRETVTTFVPNIDESKCTFCGECAKLCQFNALVILKDTTLTFAELCHSCLGCLRVCPAGAVEAGERGLGILERGNRNGIELVHGRLRIGEAMAPPLIRKVREQAGRERNVIIDAPPGTSCPVIAAVKDTDYVVMVTEPTPFGLYDLKLAVEAVRVLNLPHGLIVNRCDVGNDEVWQYAKEERIPILMEIPFQRAIAEIYARGDLIVEALPEWKSRFRSLWENIVQQAEINRGRESEQ